MCGPIQKEIEFTGSELKAQFIDFSFFCCLRFCFLQFLSFLSKIVKLFNPEHERMIKLARNFTV